MTIRTLLVFVTLLPAALAQKPSLEWQKRTTSIDYGSVPVGAHSLAELPPGQSWRLGANQQTVWTTQVPVLAGDALLAPGSYVIQLQRTGEVAAAIVAQDGGKGLGGSGVFQCAGQLAKLDKPTKKLSIEMQKNGEPVDGNQPAHVVVQFGVDEWKGAFVVPGSKTVAAGPWKLTVFSLPTALLAARKDRPVPIGSLAKNDKDGFNLVVGDSEAKLVPWPKPAAGGFGAPPPPAASDEPAIVLGKVEPLEIKVAADKPVAELASSAFAKGVLTFDVAFGKEALRVVIAEPKNKPGK